jgi:cytoskeleton protein RodZ
MMDGAGTDSHRGPNGGLAEVGAMLRDRRKELGHEIQQVANQTHIKLSYLKAIEEGRRRDLPGAAYTIGFVRTYADFLGFDGNRLVTDFHAQLAGARQRPGQAAAGTPEAPRSTVSPVLIAGAVLALAVIGFFAWGYFSDGSNSGPSTEEVEDAPTDEAAPEDAAEDAASDTATAEDAGAGDVAATESTGAAAAPESSAAPAEAPAPAAGSAAPAAAPAAQPANQGADQVASAPVEDQVPPAESEAAEPSNQDPEQVQQAAAAEGATGKVVLRARLESWVQVTNEKGESIFSRVLRAGETYTVPNEPNLVMTTGNAGGIEIMLDGKKLKSLGSVGLVRRDFPLDPKKLKDGSAYKPATPPAATQ